MGSFEAASELEKENLPFAVVTITGTEGTVPRTSGRMVVSPEGRVSGTIGGGEIEYRASQLAKEAIVSGRGGSHTLQHGAGGRVTIFIDVPVASHSAVIVGSGHVGAAIASLLKGIGWRTAVLERGASREELLAAGIDSRTAIIIAGKADASLVPAALSTPAFYVGLLASRSLSIERDPRLYFPIGLDIGEETPEEIAVSVAAEILGVFHSRGCAHHRAWNSRLVLVRGAGDLATGTIIRLHNAGYSVVAAEIEKPTVIRRTVSFAEAVYEGEMTVEGVKAVHVSDMGGILRAIDRGEVPVIADPSLSILGKLRPAVLVDAIIAKCNLGTKRGMAPFVVALGPGFRAGVDVDAVIETKRGHTLGSIIYSGSAIENTGIPGEIAGVAAERVMHSPSSGEFRTVRSIGDIVQKGDVIAYVGESEVRATIDGRLRGLLRTGLEVPEGFKIADIDPRGENADHTTVSDKARAIAGGVLEAVDRFLSAG